MGYLRKIKLSILINFAKFHFLCHKILLVLEIAAKYMVGCRGVSTVRGLVPGYPWEVPLRLRLGSLLYSLKVSLKLKLRTLV